MKQRLEVRYTDESGIEIAVDVEVASCTVKNAAGGGVLEWRTEGGARVGSGQGAASLVAGLGDAFVKAQKARTGKLAAERRGPVGATGGAAGVSS